MKSYVAFLICLMVLPFVSVFANAQSTNGPCCPGPCCIDTTVSAKAKILVENYSMDLAQKMNAKKQNNISEFQKLFLDSSDTIADSKLSS